MAITGLTVLEGLHSQPEDGWTRIEKNLNSGTGGTPLFFAFERDGHGHALTDVLFLIGDNPITPTGYTLIGIDLNKGAGGRYLYACYTRDRGKGYPLAELDVLIAPGNRKNSKYAHPPYPWERIDLDLNAGARGDFIFLIYR